MRRRAVAAGLLALVGLVAACGVAGATDEPVGAPADLATAQLDRGDRGPALLLKHGWDAPTPSFVAQNLEAMAASPFDGVVVTAPEVSTAVMAPAPLRAEDVRAVLGPMAAARGSSLSHNFVILYATPVGSFADAWDVPVANFSAVAGAARESGLEGVFFDVESYFGPAWVAEELCPGLSEGECADAARRRGSEVMRAMVDAFPDVTVIVTLGAWASDPRTNEVFGPVAPYVDVSRAVAVRGHFLVGMATAGQGTDATFVDGGELYTLRTPEQFAAAHHWLSTGLAAEGSVVPDGLRSQYTAGVEVAFGVYDQPWLGQPMDSELWRTTLERALATTDEYVWAYTEQHDWWGTGWPREPVPEDWVQSTRTAVGRD